MTVNRPANKGGFIVGIIGTLALIAINIFAYVNNDFDESGRRGPYAITLPLALLAFIFVAVQSWFKGRKGPSDGRRK